MPEITQVQTEADYEAALARIEDLIDSAPGSEEDAELDRISDLVIRYEDEHFPMENPTPDALVEFLLDQKIVSRQELLPLVGGNTRLDAMMAGRLAITPELAQVLNEHSGIPVEDLIMSSLDNQKAQTDQDTYEPHREIYQRLRNGLTDAPYVLEELLGALGVLISEYDTSIRENRFIVGGATERMIAATMRCVGIRNARARGLNLYDEDIVVDDCQISVKGSFTGGRQPIRLINTLGNSSATWRTATIFVLANRGIGYADPELLPDATRASRDAVILPRQPLDDLHDAQPQWLLKCDVPAKLRDSSQRRAASEAVATEILHRTAAGQAMFPTLRVAM